MFQWIAAIAAIVLLLSFLGLGYYSSPPTSYPSKQQTTAEQEHAQQSQKTSIGRSSFWHFLFPDSVAVFTLVLAFATVALGVIATIQIGFLDRSERIATETAQAAKASAEAAQDQIQLSRRALVQTQRAFVNLKGFNVFHIYDITQNNKIVDWQFTPIWENSGQTPTKKLNVISGIHPGEFPPDFEFKIDKFAPSLLGPKGGMTGETYRISLAEIYEIKSGAKTIYIWGRAEYNDVFPGTRRHYTNFCHKIVVTGDPTIVESGIQMIAQTIGNYTDDDYEE